ncbi:TPA_asm: N [Glehnia littoralis virus 1]|uniref:Nucleoprotein n=1 Tax=Glehnia littoralis virus 1 TaxID=2793728 RepID=A0A8D9UIP4_9RHAB|nr:N [Glehnia littoralis virus 1] [Glehnia littoralis virus 1]DAF42321.1 TPA_asm: N [Glehnia littoralis virus 1]
MSAALAAALAAQTRYSGVDDIGVNSGRPVSVWEIGHEKKIKIYDVSAMDARTANKYGTYMMDCLGSGANINSDLAKIMLSLAVSMRDPEEITNFLLSKPVRDAKFLMPFALKAITVVSDGGEEDNIEAENLRKLQQLSSGGELKQKITNAMNNNDDEENEDFNEDVKASFYSFVAGYFMRVQTRQVDNAHTNFAKSKDRYGGWYDEGMDLFDRSEIPRESIEKLKAVMTRKPELTGTWVMWLAHTENEKELAKQSRGLLEYIGLQIFAYQGLHIMNQLLTLKALSKASMGMLLRQLDCPLTRDGVREVYHILMNLEVTTKAPNRKTYFRYARVWNDGYFTQIRSQSCAPFLYTVAKVVKELDTASKSDPTQIYAIQQIGDSLKKKLDDAASKLVDMLLNQNTQDVESGDIWM